MVEWSCQMLQWFPSDLRTKEKAQFLIKLSQYNKVNQTHRVQTGVICDIKLRKTDEPCMFTHLVDSSK